MQTGGPNWRDLYQIEPGLLRQRQSVADGQDTTVLPILVNELNFADADLFVDARTILLRRDGSHRASNGGKLLLPLNFSP